MRIALLGLALMKGTRHRSLPEIEVSRTGPVGDRELCLVQPDRHRVVRTVEHPELIQVETWRSGGTLSAAFPGHTVVDEPRPAARRIQCDYWGRAAELELLESAHAAAFSELLGTRVVLARVVRPGEVVYGAAITLVTTSGLAELADRVGDPRVVREAARFRATATVEDDGLLQAACRGTRLRLGDASVEITGPIPRCAVIDYDPVTGMRDRALLKTLGSYRRGAGEVWFGHYARVVSPGRCRTGDRVIEGA